MMKRWKKDIFSLVNEGVCDGDGSGCGKLQRNKLFLQRGEE